MIKKEEKRTEPFERKVITWKTVHPRVPESELGWRQAENESPINPRGGGERPGVLKKKSRGPSGPGEEAYNHLKKIKKREMSLLKK